MQDIIPDTPGTALRRPLRMLGWLSIRSVCEFSLAFAGSLEKHYFTFATLKTSIHVNSVFVPTTKRIQHSKTSVFHSQQSPCHVLVGDPKLEDCLFPACWCKTDCTITRKNNQRHIHERPQNWIWKVSKKQTLKFHLEKKGMFQKLQKKNHHTCQYRINTEWKYIQTPKQSKL